MPAAQQTIEQRAIDAIRKSSSMEFKTSLDWGQWCRNVAYAAWNNDEAKLTELTKEEA